MIKATRCTGDKYIELVKAADVKISMAGKGRSLDNVYIERFWRTVKQQEVYLNEYGSLKKPASASAHSFIATTISNPTRVWEEKLLDRYIRKYLPCD